jgi:hypothetical protein
MAFPNKPHRRINYNYLARLDEALELVGHSARDIPITTLRSPWPVIKQYIEDNLKLRVCGWCKLPKAASEMAPSSSMCLQHFDQLQSNKAERLNIANRTHDSIKSRRKSSKYVEGMLDLLRQHSDQETEPVDVSMPEQPRKPTAWDILERASVRSTGNADTKKNQV